MTFRIEATDSGICILRRRVRLGGRKGRAAARRLDHVAAATQRCWSRAPTWSFIASISALMMYTDPAAFAPKETP